MVDSNCAVPGLTKVYGFQAGFLYQHALKGMSANVPEERLETLKHDPRVACLVKYMERHINDQSMPTGIQDIFADTNHQIGINDADDYHHNATVMN